MSIWRRLRLGWPQNSMIEELRTGLAVTVGCVIFAITVTLFVVPARLPSAGITGISLFLNYRWGISLGLSSALLNLALFIYAWRALSKRFLYWSLYASALISVAFELTAYLPTITIRDPMLLVVVSGVLQGIAFAMVFSVGASTGGTDIITAAIKKKTGAEVGSVSMVLNTLVLALFIGTIVPEKILYGVVMNYIMSQVMNNDIRAFGARKEAMIVTKHVELVRDYIVNQLHRGVTILEGEGGYDRQKRVVMISLLTTRQALNLKMFLKNQDPTAFMRLGDVSEVLGTGFRPWSRDL